MLKMYLNHTYKILEALIHTPHRVVDRAYVQHYLCNSLKRTTLEEYFIGISPNIAIAFIYVGKTTFPFSGLVVFFISGRVTGTYAAHIKCLRFCTETGTSFAHAKHATRGSIYLQPDVTSYCAIQRAADRSRCRSLQLNIWSSPLPS